MKTGGALWTQQRSSRVCHERRKKKPGSCSKSILDADAIFPVTLNELTPASSKHASETRNQVTTLLGLRRTSPMPPPFRNPSFRVVTMHMISESQCRSLPSSSFSSPPTRRCSNVSQLQREKLKRKGVTFGFFSVDMQLTTRLTTKTTKLQHEYSPL